jgi:hypothetical protein
MPAQALSGTTGNFSLASQFAIKTASWNADFVHDSFRSTAFDSGGFHEEVGGCKQLVGSFAGYATGVLGNADFNDANDQYGVAYTLTADTGKTYSGNCIVTRVSHGVDINGNQIVMGTFRSTGTYTITGGS